MSTFIISPINSLTPKKLDGLLPNFNNTLDRFDKYTDSINVPECQKFLTSETIPTQIRTDFDTITATLIGEDGGQSNLPVTEVSSYSNFSFYNFYITGQGVGKYRVIVTATKDTETVNCEFEPFELVSGTSTRITGGEVKIIEGYKRVKYYNSENEFYIDYSTGIKHFIWIPAELYWINPLGEVDVYNSLDNKEKLEQTNFRGILLKSRPMLRHLFLKFSEASSMDYFAINDVEYILPEVLEPSYYGDANVGTIEVQVEERFTVGINSDDEGFTCDQQIIDGGLVMNIGQDNLSAGTLELTVLEGYKVKSIDWRLKSGTSATVKVGTTVGGEDLSRPKTSTVALDPVSIEKSKILDWDGTGTVYITKTGVGAVIDFWMTLITFKGE